MHCQRNQSHHCLPARSTAETFKLNPFQPCANGIYFPKGIAKEQEHGKTSYKVFSLNLLHQIEEDVGKISFNKSWGINGLVFYAKKTFPSLKRTWQRNKRRAKKRYVASKSFRSWILKEIQIDENVISPTVLKQNVTRQRMPERNLLMKFQLNKPLVF